jgi:hypothetical protein
MLCVFRALLQPLLYVRALGEPPVQNLRQPDQRSKIKRGPFCHHAVKYFAAVLLPCAIKAGKEVRASAFLVPHARPRPRWDSFLPRSFAAISAMATCFFASARATAPIARCTEERGIGMSVTSVCCDGPRGQFP